MVKIEWKLLLLVAFLECGSMANAQLPNEKFGKPSSMEWDFNGWGDAIHADAIILCKTMKVTYQLSDQVFNNNQSESDLSAANIDDFGKNQIDESNILVNYEFRLRTKILKPEGAKHANIDITYFSSDDDKMIADELLDLKIKVFTKNEKGKVEKKTVNTDSFVKERVDNNYMVLHVVVPDVQPGSIIEYQYNDIDIPAFLQFKMNVPINKLITSGVEVGHLAYDTNRADLKRGKTCVTNHYKIVGDYILPEPEGEKIAVFTSQIVKPTVTPPAYISTDRTHLKIQ